MHITFVTNSFGFGGAAKMMLFIAASMQERGHKVSIVNINTTNAFLREPAEGIEVRNANIKYQSTLKTNYKWLRFVYDNVKALKPDVLVAFITVPCFLSSVVGKLLHIPAIISERGNPYVQFSKTSKFENFKLWCINHADGGVFQTQGASEFYSQSLQKKSTVIPNPIFINEEIPSINYDVRPHSVVYLGRLNNKQKRLDIAVKSFALFHESHPGYKLVVYGRGQDEDLMKKFAVEQGIMDCVEFKGATSSPLQALSKEGIFLITSDYEGISNSLLEAMAVGLPVVSTDHSPGGARLLIQDHQNGLLAPVHDAGALADAMSEFADNPSLAESCGKEATKVLERFAPKRIIDQWETYINNVVSRYK